MIRIWAPLVTSPAQRLGQHGITKTRFFFFFQNWFLRIKQISHFLFSGSRPVKMCGKKENDGHYHIISIHLFLSFKYLKTEFFLSCHTHGKPPDPTFINKRQYNKDSPTPHPAGCETGSRQYKFVTKHIESHFLLDPWQEPMPLYKAQVKMSLRFVQLMRLKFPAGLMDSFSIIKRLVKITKWYGNNVRPRQNVGYTVTRASLFQDNNARD